ncbi:putative germin-like protein 2-1 [Morella rubra]|uniref:Germin-like protein n=1 Tax=Morella rubra TaxID=262757 RepID=A0A6A1V375_9ROSI|nr:putative germin-like protein 2-1 [Morella rubra]
MLLVTVLLFSCLLWPAPLPLLPTLVPCKTFVLQPKILTDAKADDFFFSGLDKPGNTSNRQGSNVTAVNVDKLVGLNTLGISVARIDFAPYCLNPPHTHPCTNDVIVVLEGTLYVGFVTSNTDNHLFTKVLNKGDVFVFLVGLIHFQWNMGNTDALVFAALNSHNPSVITIANVVFGTNPPINCDVLSKAFWWTRV